MACLIAYRSWYWWIELPPEWITIKYRSRIKSQDSIRGQEMFNRIGRGVTIITENSAASVINRAAKQEAKSGANPENSK